MNTGLIVVGIAATVLGVATTTHFGQPEPKKLVQVSQNKVGTKPGNIGKSVDYLKTARERGNDLAIIGGGCFWCTESEYRQIPGIVATAVGYSGGHVDKPTYKEVCGGKTGHVEVTLIEFDPKKISYETVIRKFFEMHDPTQGNRQGPDFGEQYRSVIFTYDTEQEKTATKVRLEIDKSGKYNRPLTTEVAPVKNFFMAEDYHQQYYEKKGIGVACKIPGLSGSGTA